MGSSRTIVIAGAGIGGLTAALAIAERGFRVVLLEQSARLSETGAGIQISPNAARILVALGLEPLLKPALVAPETIRIRQASSGRELASLPLATAVRLDYGAPYWLAHRSDLQAALLDLARARPDIALELGAKFEDFAVHPNGVTVEFARKAAAFDVHGAALVGADGLWSSVRARLGDRSAPRPANRTAWRTVLPASAVAPEMREPAIGLWLGRDSHLVHYPVKGGAAINIVAIAADRWQGSGWSAPCDRDEVLARFPRERWAAPARDLLALPERWLKWALHDRPPRRPWGDGPVTLLGDAAHPMLPFLAQGAAAAIEDAAVLAQALAATPSEPAAAMRAYERERRPRAARLQRAARLSDFLYHVGGPLALMRNLGMAALGGELLLSRYDWIYAWRAE